MRSRRSFVALVMAIFGLLLSSLATDVAAAGAATSGTPGVTKTSIKVGGVVTFTSASGFSEAGVDVGARARFALQNSEGGVYGRKIDYVGSKDDGLSASTDLQIVQQLVQDQNVFAVVPVGAPAFSSGGNFLVQSQVPFIGWGTTPPFCGNPYGFGIFGCDVVTGPSSKVSTATGQILGSLVHGAKGKTAAAIAADSAAGAASLPSAVDGLEGAGFKVVYDKAALPAGAVTDYTPYAQDIMSSNNGKAPDVVYAGIETSQVVGLRQALVAAGFKGVMIDGVSYDPAVLAVASSRQALQGEYVSVPFQPFQSTAPAVKEMLKALKKKQVGKGFVPSQYEAYGYWMADMFIAMLKKAGPNLTRASFTAATKKFTYTGDGGTGKVSFPEDHTAPAPCAAVVQIVGTKFVVKKALKCYSDVAQPAS